MVSGNEVERHEATEARLPARQLGEAEQHLNEVPPQQHLSKARAQQHLNEVPAQEQLNVGAGDAEAACSSHRSTKQKGVLIRPLKTTQPPTACLQECQGS